MSETKHSNTNQEQARDVDLSGSENTVLQEGVDYYLESGLMVLTSTFLARRGYCCERGCRHCPYSDNQNREG